MTFFRMTSISRRLVLPLLLVALVSSPEALARTRAAAHPVTPPLSALPPDIYSASEPTKITARHLTLDLTVDFATRQLRGSATIEFENLTGTDLLILDTRALTIERVTLDDGSSAAYALDAVSSLGRPLSVVIKPTTRSVTVHYTTSPDADGLHWNTAAQSFGRRFPYLYSQNESDHARSWIPIQDTPSVRMTYDATIRVTPGLMAVMSAVNPTLKTIDGVYRFHMPQAIPAYLIALAVANLEFKPIGTRTGVYAEPELIDDAVWELQYMPRMVDVAEQIAGPYPFERYDVVLMPPTYIVGGMEHPRANFINPFSVVTGNRPANPLPSSLIAHELAHSWAGDSTTLATWADIWLNEGITEYLTQRILEELSGPERVEYNYFTHRQAIAGFNNVQDPRVTLLHRRLIPSEAPDAGFNTAAYTKGELFLKTLEDGMGRAALDAFLRDYFAKFAFRWVDERNFLSLLRDHLVARPELETSLRVLEWIYDPGLPRTISAPTTSALFNRVNAQATAFRNGAAASAIVTDGWTDIELTLFLQLADQAVRLRMSEVDARFGLSMRVTPPTTWLRQSIRANYGPASAAIERALMRGGSNGTILTLYSELVSSNQRDRGRTIFEQAKDRYADEVRDFVAQLLGVSAAAKAAA